MTKKKKTFGTTPCDWQKLDPAKLEPRHWIYGHHYLEGAVSATIADGGLGKSTLALTEAIAIVTGRPLLGITPNKKVFNDGAVRDRYEVLYYNAEESLSEIKRRVLATCQHFGIDLSELNQPYSKNPWRAAANLTIISGHDYPLVIAAADEEEGDEEEGRFTFSRNIEYLESYEGDVIILDPFVSIHQCPENNNSMIDAIVKRLGRVASMRPIAIELVHHSRKPAHGGNIEIGAADARGASSFGDGVRSLRTLNRMTEREAKQAKVDNARNFFRLDNPKGNYAAAQESSLWYRHQSIPLPNGDDVGVVLPWHFPGAFDGVTADHMRSVRNLARSGQYRADPRADEWIHQAVAQVLDLDLKDEGDLKRIKQILKVWIEKGVLQKVEREDEARRKRMFVEPSETPIDDETVRLKPSPRKKKSDEFQPVKVGKSDEFRPVKVGRAPDGITCVQCQTADERPVWKIRDGRVPYGQAGGKPECLHEDCAEKWFTGQFHP